MDAGFLSSVNCNETSSLLPSLYSFLNSTNYSSKNNLIYASESFWPNKPPQAVSQLNCNIYLWRYKSCCHISPHFSFLLPQAPDKNLVNWEKGRRKISGILLLDMIRMVDKAWGKGSIESYPWGWDVVQLVESLPSIYKSLGSMLSTE